MCGRGLNPYLVTMETHAMEMPLLTDLHFYLLQKITEKQDPLFNDFMLKCCIYFNPFDDNLVFNCPAEKGFRQCCGKRR